MSGSGGVESGERQVALSQDNVKGNKLLPQRYDSLDLESGAVSGYHGRSSKVIGWNPINFY